MPRSTCLCFVALFVVGAIIVIGPAAPAAQPAARMLRLKLAQILLSEEKRPGKALKVMAKIDPSALDARQREVLGKLRAKAEQLRGQDTYELAEEEE